MSEETVKTTAEQGKDGKSADQGRKRKRVKLSAEEKERRVRIKRGPAVEVKKLKDKKLKGKLKHAERLYEEAQSKAVKANEWLLPAEAGYLETEGVERTWNVKQTDLLSVVEKGAAHKIMELRLTQLGPYTIDFTRSGRHCAIAGAKGHLAIMDWQRSQLVCEVQVKETTRAVKFLHNETFFAAAQKKYVYIYDKRGVEVHCCKDHIEPQALEFLPHHFLLASIGSSGVLHYQDTSTGHIVATHRTRLGPCSTLVQNPWNAVLGCGHAGGVVTMWTPNITSPVVKMLCHRGPVNAVAFDQSGRYMVTAGADSQVKVWDVRTFQPLHSYFAYSPATSLDISQRGVLAVGYGRKVQLWKDALAQKADAPYMTHQVFEGDKLTDFQFVPYEDVLGIGSTGGFSTILVPGAGEPNFDSLVANPYASLRERREQEVAQLLDKLQPETIVLDPETIATIRREPLNVQRQRKAEAEAANAKLRKEQLEKGEKKEKMKGKNKPSKRHRKKQSNVIEEKKPGLKQKLEDEAERKRAAAEAKAAKEADVLASVPRALQKLYKG